MRFTAEAFSRRISEQLSPADAHPIRGTTPRAIESAPSPSPINVSNLYNLPDNETFLREAYRLILGREIDTYGFVRYREMLRNHIPRNVVLRNLIDSDEARASGRQFTGLQEVRGAAGTLRYSLQRRFRSALGTAFLWTRNLLELLMQGWRFELLDAKMDLLKADLAAESARVDHHAEQRLWHLSEKLDAYTVELRSVQKSALARLEKLAGAVMALERRLGETRDQVSEYSSAIRSLNDSLSQERLLMTQVSDRVSGISARIYPPVVSGGDNIVATEVEGLILGIPAEEWRLAAYHLFRGAPEVGLARALQNAIQPGMVVVDVGANIGLFTLISARCVGYSGKVFSFEPSPRIFALLRDNIQVNGWLETGVIDFRQIALSNFTGTATFNVFPATSGHSNLYGGPPDCQRIEVETDTLDHALSTIPKVDVIKIDAEGAEPFILRGMRETLKRNPRMRLFIEFAPTHLERAGVNPASFLDELAEIGFEILTVDDLTGECKVSSKEQLLRQSTVNLSLILRERASSPAR